MKTNDPALKKEQFYERAGITEAPPIAKPGPLPQEDAWASDLNDEDLKAVDVQTYKRRQARGQDLAKYINAVLDRDTKEYQKEFQEKYQFMPKGLGERIAQRYVETVAREPQLYFDQATQTVHSARLQEMHEAIVREECAVAGFEPEEDIDEMIRNRERDRARKLAPISLPEEKE